MMLALYFTISTFASIVAVVLGRLHHLRRFGE